MNKWLSVEEEHPSLNKTEFVELIVAYWLPSRKVYAVCTGCFNESKFHDHCNAKKGSILTHWRYLPAPPETDETK